MMPQHRMVNHYTNIIYRYDIHNHHNIYKQINICEESSWIPPTCFPASTELAQYQFHFKVEYRGIWDFINIIRYYAAQ
jgi:hypothetical protein